MIKVLVDPLFADSAIIRPATSGASTFGFGESFGPPCSLIGELPNLRAL
jgi:hypothetical protein